MRVLDHMTWEDFLLLVGLVIFLHVILSKWVKNAFTEKLEKRVNDLETTVKRLEKTSDSEKAAGG